MIKSEQREIEDRKVYLGQQVDQLMVGVGTLFQVPAIESMPFETCHNLEARKARKTQSFPGGGRLRSLPD